MSGKIIDRKRIDWIDIAKGIGIILVVWGHTAKYGQDIRLFIYCFHMPLFFFISGMVFNCDVKFKDFLIKRLKSLYLPYLTFLTVDYLTGFIFVAAREGLSFFLIKDAVVAFIMSITGTEITPNWFTFNVPIWFLCALFFAEIFLYFILKAPKKVLPIIILIGILGSYFIKIPIPFCISYLFPISVFFSAGYLLKNKLNKLSNFISFDSFAKTLFMYILAAMLLVTLIIKYRFNSPVSMLHLTFKNIVLFYFNSFIGIFTVIFISIVIKLKRPFIYFGKNSIIVLCFHYYFTKYLFPFLFEILGLNEFLYNSVIEIILTFITLAIMIPIITLVNKHFYFIFGKKPRRNL